MHIAFITANGVSIRSWAVVTLGFIPTFTKGITWVVELENAYYVSNQLHITLSASELTRDSQYNWQLPDFLQRIWTDSASCTSILICQT